MDCGRARCDIGERHCRLRRRGQVRREWRAFARQRRRVALARKRIAARRSDSRKRLCNLVRMRIWSDDWRDGFHRRGERRLREIHGEARGRPRFRGFGGLGAFEFLAAVTAGDFSEALRIGILFGVDRGLNRIRRRCRGIIFASFDAGAILLGENLRLLQIFVGINVSFFFLLRGLARFFLARGFGDLRRVLHLLLSKSGQGQHRSGCAEKEQDAKAEWQVEGPSRVGHPLDQVLLDRSGGTPEPRQP